MLRIGNTPLLRSSMYGCFLLEALAVCGTLCGTQWQYDRSEYAGAAVVASCLVGYIASSSYEEEASQHRYVVATKTNSVASERYREQQRSVAQDGACLGDIHY